MIEIALLLFFLVSLLFVISLINLVFAIKQYKEVKQGLEEVLENEREKILNAHGLIRDSENGKLLLRGYNL